MGSELPRPKSVRLSDVSTIDRGNVTTYNRCGQCPISRSEVIGIAEGADCYAGKPEERAAMGDLGLINWIDLLNADTTWSSRDDLRSFVSDALGNSAHSWSDTDYKMSNANADEINNAAIYMRYQLAALHFNAPVNLSWVNERLGQSNFRVYERDTAPDCKLPRLRAVNMDTSEDSLVRSFIDTFVLQFTQYISSALEGSPIYTVSRCEGLHKSAQLAECEHYYQTHSDLEAKWILELAPNNPVVAERLMDVARCADFFLQKGNGKFCSDSCRFSTFAIRKQVSDPNYHAEKQKRYRRSKGTEG